MEFLANTNIKIPFVGSTTGLTTFPDLTILKDGSVSIITYTTTEVGNKLYVLNANIALTGDYSLFVNGTLQASFKIVSKSLYSYLTDILDESIGSWVWDKTANTLLLLRQNGSQLATFNIVDNNLIASRERIS